MGILFPLCSCAFAQSGSDAGTAVITLDVRFDWGDGSGYQILLDADHNAYDSLIPDYSTNLLSEGEAGSLYAAFEYKMPETASGSLTEGFFTGAGRWSMEVPAGVYDYVVANPTPGSGIWVANGMDGRGNDFHFEAGYEYIFRITRQLVNGNVRDFCERRVPSPIDLAVSAILSPLSGTGLDDNTAVVARISNEGLDTVSSFLLRYSIDGGSPVEEPVEQTLAPEETIEHTFAVRADFSELRSYNLQVEVAAEGDTVDGNNVLECVIDHVEPVPVPFRVDFNDTSDIGNFRILDANEDGMSWVRTTTIWPDADGNEMDPGSVYGKYLEIACPSSRPMDDWLMVFPPVRIPAGTAHIGFNYKGGYDYSTEHLQVWYGTSSNVDDMTLLRDLDGFWGGEWFYNAANIQVEEEGDYYFAFRACSEANSYSIMLDNVSVDAGPASGIPDLVMEKLLLPVSSCGLGQEERVGVRLNNAGAFDITSYTLSYTVNGQDTVTQAFTDTIFIQEAREVWFDVPADFSSLGSRYEIQAWGMVNLPDGALTENRTEDNAAEGTVTHYAPASLPLHTEFSTQEGRDDWAFDAGSWYFDTTYGLFANTGMEPMLSRCVRLEEGQGCRFAFRYMAGLEFMGMYLYEDFDVLYGLSGTDLASWDTLFSFRDEYTGSMFVDAEQAFVCEAAGDYSFAFVPRVSNMTLYLDEVSVEAWEEYDVRMNLFRAYPRLMPADLANAPFPVRVEVENRGMRDVDSVLVTVLDASGTEAGRAWMDLGVSGAVAGTGFLVDLDGLAVGDMDTLTATVSIPGQEDSNLDNALLSPLMVTRDEMAYDRMEESMYAASHLIGMAGRFGCGLPFYLPASDTLTGISVGWGAEGPVEFGLSVHGWDAQGKRLGDLLYEGSFVKEEGTGQIRYEMPAMLLDTGFYMFSVELDGEFLVADLQPGGLLYLTSVDPVVEQTDLGYPAIRPVFGAGELHAADMEVARFLKPVDTGLFAANEAVVLEVANNGYQEAEAGIRICVDGEWSDAKTITLGGYSRQEVGFTADLSAPGRHELTAVVSCTEDSETANDTLTKIIYGLQAVDPYVMDFEHCMDFAISNFNPAWTSVDGDGVPTLGFTGVDFPHHDEAFGFIAFNPALTDPVMNPGEAPEIQPHGGVRFGAAFDPQGSGQSNDWLISPLLELPAEDAGMRLFVKSYVAEYGLEKYNILVSETGSNPEDFEIIGETREAPADSWTEVTVDLSDYAGKSVYIAIQCVSEDAFIFMVDDIQVSRPAGNESGSLSPRMSLYPNPASDKVVLFSSAPIERARVFSTSGHCLFDEVLAGGTEFVYDVSALAPGLYLIQAWTSQGTAVLKLIVR